MQARFRKEPGFLFLIFSIMNSEEPVKLRLAIQKSGRLNEDSIQLIKECGIHFNGRMDKLKSEAANFPIEILYLRDDDIPGYVSDGVADIGIVGDNVVEEKEKAVERIEYLGFAKCRLSIAVPKAINSFKANDLNGYNIATSYPKITGRYLVENGIKANIHEISGSVEIAPSIGLAEAICDIVSSGSTLMINGLKEAFTIFQSEAVLIACKGLSGNKKLILQDLIFRIRAVKKARNNKYIMLNAPNSKLDQICKILPGMKSPSILPLADSGWSSVHSVVQEDNFWAIIENLKEQGAQGILVLPIEKMII
jgi:ATP phosphoribosyltransferase